MAAFKASEMKTLTTVLQNAPRTVADPDNEVAAPWWQCLSLSSLGSHQLREISVADARVRLRFSAPGDFVLVPKALDATPQVLCVFKLVPQQADDTRFFCTL